MYTPTATGAAAPKKITVPELRGRKAAQGQARISMITAYDFTMARLVEEGGAEMVLVGDSLGMVVQGQANTLPVTMDDMVYHCRAVARGLARAHLVGDLPFLSYQASPEKALESAGRLMKEGFCESVKLEGGAEYAPHVKLLVRAGIPVVGHIGLTPQSVHALGGFKMQGRGDEAGKRLLADALALEEAGAFCIVLEAVPPDVAAAITEALTIPTIGIGAGVQCDGQVLVCTDLLGMGRGHSPKFVKRFANVADIAVAAFQSYVDEVRSGAFPGVEHSFKANRPAAPVSDVQGVSAPDSSKRYVA